MAFVQFSKVSLSFGDRTILNDVSLNLNTGTKAALTGANGSGKSTLMKVFAGLQDYDSGERAVQKDTRIVYLPQSGIIHTGTTLLEEADKAFHFGYELVLEMEQIGNELADKNNILSESKQQQLLERHHEISEILENSGWYRRNALAEQTLTGLGFSQSDFQKPCTEFSGGWQMRIALAKSLLQNPDILLLDEPTNYLDLEARNWLEEFLINFTGGFLLVSHDRYFLDVTINEVYELFNGELKRYVGNYSHYEKVREVEMETIISKWQQQQDEIQKLEDFIRRFGYKATKAAQAQERQKMLDKILEDKIEIPENLKKIHFSFPPSPHSGRLVVVTESLEKTWFSKIGNNEIIKNLDLIVEKGQRLVVVGKNGAGKSTLLRMIAGEDNEFTGTIKLGSGVTVGYFSQDNAEKLTGSQSIIEMLETIAPMEMIPKLRDMLGAFLFRSDDIYKSIDILSGGEKSRLALLKILLRPVNLLVLDEPTNHLDIHSKDVLLDALKKFSGTIIFVSHDRGFIESLATHVLELNPGSARIFPGDYKYYCERIIAESEGVISPPNESVNDKIIRQNYIGQVQEKSAGKISYEEEKKIKAAQRKKEKEEERLLNEISLLEEKKSELENQMSDPLVYSNGEKCKEVHDQITEIALNLEKLTEEWMNLHEQE
ncbi:MAG: ABC-F family ATP-binding cassette domain-containing protein [Treponema sp.]|nr:ABC-F family ATP-binding cassette domain-containing protein [Treponema sp.]